MDPRWKHPFTCIVAGPTSCGKTHFVSRMIENAGTMIYPPPENIIWYYGEWQKAYSELAKKASIKFIEGLPNENDIIPSLCNLVVIDDLLAETDARVTKLFTKGSHHKNTSVIYITQNIFSKNKENRTISLNAHYMVLFKSPRDVMQMEHLARQMYPGNTKYMREAFSDATCEPHSYLLIDLRPETPDELRLRTKIFPGEMQIVYMKR